jgi:nicotinamide-nucleotide amidase
MSDKDMIAALAEEIKSLCLHKKFMVVTAESCTAGLVAGAITSVPGLSDVFDRGYITYSNEAQIEGAVSREVARAMAEGALKRAGAQLAVSVTGIAGPTGATREKPIGRVHVGVCINGMTDDQVYDFGDIGREAVRTKAVIAALQLALDRLKQSDPH